MKSILQKFSITDSQQTADNIINVYNNQWYCIVNFIYFAQIVSQNVFSGVCKSQEILLEKRVLLSNTLIMD